MKCVDAIDLHVKEDVLKHLLSNINYMKIVAIVYIKYALVAVMNSIIAVIVCVLIVEHKWMIHREVVSEWGALADLVGLGENALEDSWTLIGLGENVLVDSGTLIGLVNLAFHSLFYHLTLMMRNFKRVILK